MTIVDDEVSLVLAWKGRWREPADALLSPAPFSESIYVQYVCGAASRDSLRCDPLEEDANSLQWLSGESRSLEEEEEEEEGDEDGARKLLCAYGGSNFAALYIASVASFEAARAQDWIRVSFYTPRL